MRGKIVYGSSGREYYLDGERVSKAEYDAKIADKPFTGPPMSARHAGWPRYSQALGIHPSQIKAETEAWRKKGVNVEFNARGHMKIDSQRQQRAIVKAINANRDKRSRIADFDD